MLDSQSIASTSQGRNLTSAEPRAGITRKAYYTVMSQQSDLVDVIARFDPKIVKMADAGEKPED